MRLSHRGIQQNAFIIALDACLIFAQLVVDGPQEQQHVGSGWLRLPYLLKVNGLLCDSSDSQVSGAESHQKG